MSAHLIDVTAANHDDVVAHPHGTVLLDFQAAWCGPCKQLAPIIHQIAEERSDTLAVGVVDVDQSPQLAAQYGVMSIPTVVRLDGGQVTARAQGAMPKAQLEKALNL